MPRVNPILLDDPGSILEIDDLLRGQRSEVCHVLAPSSEVDAGGAPISSGYAVVATVACRVIPGGLSSSERVAGGVFTAVGDYEVQFDRDTEIASDYRIENEGITYEVVGDNRHASHDFQLKVGVKVVS